MTRLSALISLAWRVKAAVWNSPESAAANRRPSSPTSPTGWCNLLKDGLRVLRLKGGDPFVFGRGGEEALTLVEHNMPFRVIPGITAGIGGLAYAGIPVTHRDTNHAVTFMTGHSASGLVPDTIDWAAVARGSQVIVLYMALKHLRTIAGNFIRPAGRLGKRSPSSPMPPSPTSMCWKPRWSDAPTMWRPTASNLLPWLWSAMWCCSGRALDWISALSHRADA